MITPEITRSTRVLPLSRLSRKDGMVMELWETSVYARSRGATIFQFTHAPAVRPIASHASTRPERYTAPGRPMSSHPDMSDAPADSAATPGLRLRPPSM